MVSAGCCLSARVPVRGLQVLVPPHPQQSYKLPPDSSLIHSRAAKKTLQGLPFVLQDAHEQGINAASFSSAGLLATGGSDRVVKLWDIGSGLSLMLVVLRVRDRDLSDDVIRVASTQSHAGRLHRGHHLHRLQSHG